MSKVIQQELRYCDNCEKQTVHMRNATEHNWVKTLVLTLLTGGLYLIWLIFSTVFTAPIPGTGKKSPWVCSVCGIEEGGRAITKQERVAQKKSDEDDAMLGYGVIALVVVFGYLALQYF